jgi:excisionase family DNA binding protein
MTKTCEYCKNEFEARTIYTKYCSHTCNRKAYKEAQRETKIKTAVVKVIVKSQGKLITSLDYTSIQSKELLTINEACALLNVTHVTLRRWLKENVISSSRIGKKHLIKRMHLNDLIA